MLSDTAINPLSLKPSSEAIDGIGAEGSGLHPQDNATKCSRLVLVVQQSNAFGTKKTCVVRPLIVGEVDTA